MFTHNILVVLLLWLYNIRSIHGECPAERHERHFEAELRKDVLCAYDSSYRPVKDHRTTINVAVQIAMTYISFDTTEEIFTIHCKFAMTWRDEYLTWDPNNYGGIKELLIESDNIWKPRIATYNSDDAAYQTESIYTRCLVESNGTVLCAPHVSRSGMCRTWLHNWPYDKQNCTIFFGSWMLPGEQVNLTFSGKRAVVYENFDDGPGWKLLDVTHTRLPGKFNCCPNETYPELKYTFILAREAEGLAAIIIVPSVVLFIMLLMTLLMDVKEDSRLALQCFTLFGHFMFLNEVGYNVPKHGMETPVILLLIRDSMVVSLSSVLLTLVLSSLRRREGPAPACLAKLSRQFASGPGSYVVFTEFDAANASDKALAENDAEDGQSHDPSVWLTLANLLNSIVFIIYVVIYIVMLCVYIPED